MHSSDIVKDGPYTYRVNHSWMKNIPSGIRLGKTNAVAIDTMENVYILHTSRIESTNKNTVMVFDNNGEYSHSWGKEYFGHAHGLKYRIENGEEFLYLVDDINGVFKTTLKGQVLVHFQKPSFYDRDKLSFGPANIDISENGDLYLAEGYGSCKILKYNSKGEYQGAFGGKETTNWAHGCFIRKYKGKECLYICTDDPSEIKYFDLNGAFLGRVEGDFRHPRNIIEGPDMFVIPEMQCRLTILDLDMKKTYHLGSLEKSIEEIFELRTKSSSEFLQGKFVSPHDVAFFKNGDMIVVEWVEYGRVSKLTKI